MNEYLPHLAELITEHQRFDNPEKPTWYIHPNVVTNCWYHFVKEWKMKCKTAKQEYEAPEPLAEANWDEQLRRYQPSTKIGTAAVGHSGKAHTIDASISFVSTLVSTVYNQSNLQRHFTVRFGDSQKPQFCG